MGIGTGTEMLMWMWMWMWRGLLGLDPTERIVIHKTLLHSFKIKATNREIERVFSAREQNVPRIMISMYVLKQSSLFTNVGFW